jgi:hypothetical protein
MNESNKQSTKIEQLEAQVKQCNMVIENLKNILKVIDEANREAMEYLREIRTYVDNHPIITVQAKQIICAKIFLALAKMGED